MSKILTAKEWLTNHKDLSEYCVAEYDEGGYLGTNTQKLYEIMTEFAKLHVQAALEAAANNAEMTHVKYTESDYEIDKSTIRAAYPLNNII
jgi:hypothetical protein